MVLVFDPHKGRRPARRSGNTFYGNPSPFYRSRAGGYEVATRLERQLSLVLLAEGYWGSAGKLFEETIEIGHILKPEPVSHLSYLQL